MTTIMALPLVQQQQISYMFDRDTIPNIAVVNRTEANSHRELLKNFYITTNCSIKNTLFKPSDSNKSRESTATN